MRVILIGLAILCSHAALAGFNFTSGSCRPRDAVSDAMRQPYEKAALDFTSKLVHGDIAQAHSEMREELRHAVPLEKLAELLKPNSEAFKALGPLAVSRSYLVEVGATTGKGENIIVCQADTKTPMSSPQGRVYLVTDQVPSEAYVLVEGNGSSGTWTFTLWMVRIGNGWLVNHLHFATPSELNKTPDELFELAQEQEKQGHSLNAYLFYIGVMATDYRGQKFSPGIRTESDARIKQLKLPAEFQGERPYLLHLGKTAYHVALIKLSPEQHRPALEITYQAEAGVENATFIRDFRAAHPDYLDGFDFIVAIAVDSLGNRTRSVEPVRN